MAAVAYTHDSGDGPVATTRQLVAGAWAGAVQLSDVPVRQLDLAMGSNGYATVAWTQDGLEGLDLYARRFLPAAGGWQPAALVSPRVAPQGLTGLAVNSSDASAMSYDVVGPSLGRSTYFSRTNNGRSYPQCDPDCANTWGGNSITHKDGDEPTPAAVTIHESGGTGQATLLWATGPSSGPPRIRAMQEQGDSFGPASDVSAVGDSDQLTAVSDATYRTTFATWVTHSPAGDVLYARGLATPNDKPVPDPQLAELGTSSGTAVSALARYGPGVVVWPDTTVQPAVLRSATVPVSSPRFYEVGVEMVAPQQEFTPSVLVRARWSGATTSPRYDVRTRQSGVRGPFGRYTTWKQRTPATTAQFRAARGRTVCFSSRTRSGAGATASAGAWSTERCTTVALDDTALTSRGCKRDRYDAFYGDTRLSTRTRGSTLAIKNVRTRSIALMTSRRAGNGRIAVRLGGTRLGTVRLSGRHAHRVVVPVARFNRLRSGTLTLTAVDANKPVNIDGVFLSRR